MFARKLLATAALLCLSAGTAAADSIILGGVEDYAGATTIEGHGDFNDLMFKMTGNISVLAPQTALNALTSNLVNESGTIFWDQRSIDGVDYNFGYCATGWGNCALPGPALGPLNYLAGAGGAAPLNEMFLASGAVTVTLFSKHTSNVVGDSLGWYDPSNPTVLHQLFSGTQGAGASVTFTPAGVFALYSANSIGQIYSSVAAANQGESATQQHFALLVSAIPEPGTAPLAGIMLAAAWAGKILWKKNFSKAAAIVRYL